MTADGLEIVRARILALPDILALVDPNQVYPIQLAQGAVAPTILITSVAILNGTALQGRVAQMGQRVAVEAAALSAQTVIEIGKLLVRELPCVKASMPAIGAQLVDIVFAETGFDDSSDDLLTFRRGLHFRVHWQDA